MPKFVYCEQRTPEWFAVHAGRITGSRLCDLMAYSIRKGKESEELKRRADYRDELIAERMTGSMSQHFVSEQMKRGVAEEGYARDLYGMRLAFDQMVEEIGFAIHPSFEFCGASPDGIVDGKKIIEIKNLTTVNHLKACRTREVPPEYLDQTLWTMRCCEVEEADYVSCDSRLRQRHPDLELLVIPVRYDDKRIEELEAEALKMNAEIEAQIKLYYQPR